MSENTLPASANFEKLKLKLRELFELDKADLDFGIYRILRQRHREITEFLDQHLEKTVFDALSAYQTEERGQIEGELRKAEDAARAAGISPDLSPRVAELRARLTAGGSLQEAADEVYSHLYTFFARYYQEGDFLGLQRSTVHGREKYMIPYNGEEVKMVWANMDQYYIKSSELLRDYRFHVRPSEGPLFQATPVPEFSVELNLVDGDTEKDNQKADGKTSRVFQLDRDQPFEEIASHHLRIRFRYREEVSERNLQDKINADTLKTLRDELPALWRALLFTVGEEERTPIQMHLRSFTARNQFDYFIHRDLGGFLQRELDFYIKNEVVYLDDIENSHAPKAEVYLSRIRALRRCALPIIRMLAQIENFQKKLWLKKKFVVETRYCMTVDRVPESLYPDICANEAQWVEWEDLYSLSQTPKDLFIAELKTPEFLKRQPHMMIDTRHFGEGFVTQVLAGIGDLDNSIDGLVFQSENFQALQLMRNRLRGQVDAAYLDPPYNSDAGPIAYKNGYRHSSWVAMLYDRLKALDPLLRDTAITCITIDDYEAHRLRHLCELGFLGGDLLGVVAIKNNPAGRSATVGFSICHEYAFFYGREDIADVNRLEHSDSQKARYKEQDEDGSFEWTNFRKHGGLNTYRTTRPRQFYPIFVKGERVRIPRMVWDNSIRQYRIGESPEEGEEVLLPVDNSGNERIWDFIPDTARKYDHFQVRKDSKGITAVYRKWRLNDEGLLPQTWWDKSEYSAAEYGTNLLTRMFGKAHEFTFPKSIHAVADCLKVAGMRNNDHGLAIDFFGGSGTTAHAVINLNRSDGGRRRYCLVEMAEYGNTVLLPRIKKVCYSTDWKDGAPLSRNSGIGHMLKVVRIESYEDSLNNLRLRRSETERAAQQSAEEWQRDEYMLSYFLRLESEGSASLLDVSKFKDPFSYKLNIATRTAGETKPTNVDLVETFNWLIGLRVKHIDHQKSFVTVTGEKKPGEHGLIIWRVLSDDPIEDNEALERYLGRIGINPADTEYAFIYVNGSHTLTDPHNKIHLTEEEFQRRMFEDESFESLD